MKRLWRPDSHEKVVETRLASKGYGDQIHTKRMWRPDSHEKVVETRLA